MIEDITFTYEDKKYIILDKFKKNNNNYIIYQEKNKDEIYASLYKEEGNKIIIIPIENDRDYDIVDKYLEEL